MQKKLNEEYLRTTYLKRRMLLQRYHEFLIETCFKEVNINSIIEISETKDKALTPLLDSKKYNLTLLTLEDQSLIETLDFKDYDTLITVGISNMKRYFFNRYAAYFPNVFWGSCVQDIHNQASYYEALYNEILEHLNNTSTKEFYLSKYYDSFNNLGYYLIRNKYKP